MARLCRLGWLACVPWLAGAVACSDEDAAPGVVSNPTRPAPRVLGDVFCVDPPEVKGDLRTVWALSLGGLQIGLTAMAADAHGRLAVAGTLFEGLAVGHLQLRGTNDGSPHPFVFVVDADGTVRWGKTFEGFWFPTGIHMAADGAVQVFAMVEKRPADFGAGPIDAAAAIVSLDANGNLVGAKSLGETFPNLSFVPALGPAGESAVHDEVFAELRMFDGMGNGLWQKSAGALVQGQLAFDADGNLIVGASLAGTLDWETPPFAIGSFDAVIAKLDRTGALRWIRTLGSETTSAGLSVAGNRVVVSALSRAGADVTVTSLEDGVGLEPTVTWNRTFAVDPYIGASTITSATPDGGAYALGATSSDGLAAGSGSFFGTSLARLDGLGATTATALYHGGQVFPYLMVSDANGDAYLAGSFMYAIDLGAGMLRAVSGDGTGTFLAKVARGPAPFAEPRCGTSMPGVVLGDPSPIVPIAMAIAGDSIALTTGAEIFAVPATRGERRLLAEQQRGTVAIATDGQSVYWGNAGTENADGTTPRDGSIMSIPLAGGTAKTLVADLAGVVALAVDDRTLYFAVGPVKQGTSVTLGKLMSISIEGGTPKLLASDYIDIGPLAANAGSVVVAGRTLATGSQNIARITGAGAMTTLAFSDRKIVELVLDDDNVYWLDLSERDDGIVGQVLSVKLDGGPQRVLAGSLRAPAGLAAVGDDVYFSASGRGDLGFDLLRVPKLSGDRGAIARGFAMIGPIASDGDTLAWVQRVDEFTWSLIVRRP